MLTRISIIIVNWNGKDHLSDCLDSLLSQSFKGFEVIIVDNGSTDDSVSFVRLNYPWVKLILLEENTGFAAGNNLGLKHACGEYIITLNNDTKADPDWLQNLVRVADLHPQIGMVGSRICTFSDPDVIDSISIGVCVDGMSRGRYRNKRWSELTLPENAEILFPSACAALYRRDMIDKVGFFDEDFFAYAEDTDLGLRGRLAGWGAMLASNAVVYHKYSQSGGSFSPFKVYLVERNHYWVAIKNFPLQALLLLPFFTVLRYLEQISAVLFDGGSGREFRASSSPWALLKALGKGVFDSFKGVPWMLRKRRKVMQIRKLSMREFSDLLHAHRITFRELLDND